MERGMGIDGIMLKALATAVALLTVAAAQGNPPACAQRLIPCAQYLESPKPPESCCGELRKAVQNELTCLCSILNNKQLLETFKVNATQALELPKHCGLSSDTSLCAATNTTTGAGGPTAPPATAGGNNGTAAAAVTRVGASGVACLLALSWSLFA